MTMQTHSTATLVSADQADVYPAVLGLVRALWSVGDDEIVVASPPSTLVHSISLDGQTTCWLTWELTQLDATTTRLRLSHDELDDGSLPEPELDAVLALVLKALAHPADTTG